MGLFFKRGPSRRSEFIIKMLIPKKNRIAIYESLFKDGVMVAIKDYNLMKHNDLEKIRNLEVIKAMLSLKSRGYVRENFTWRHYYWYLTNEGIQYLRDYLHLPPEIVPATLKRQARTDARSRPSQPPSSGGFGGDKMDSDRSAYRRAPGAANGTADKAGAAGPGSAPMEFRGGFGRGQAE